MQVQAETVIYMLISSSSGRAPGGLGWGVLIVVHNAQCMALVSV